MSRHKFCLNRLVQTSFDILLPGSAGCQSVTGVDIGRRSPSPVSTVPTLSRVSDSRPHLTIAMIVGPSGTCLYSVIVIVRDEVKKTTCRFKDIVQIEFTPFDLCLCVSKLFRTLSILAFYKLPGWFYRDLELEASLKEKDLRELKREINRELHVSHTPKY